MKPQEIKIVLLGNSNVGKSSILFRYTTDSFNQQPDPTIGAQFMSKQISVQNQIVRFNIWDTAGQERYKTLAKMYYRDTSVAIIVYDITNRQSFNALEHWVKELDQLGPKNMIKIVVGNKLDLEDIEVVSEDEAERFGFSVGAWTTRTSAKWSTGVDEIFQVIARKSISCTPSTRNTVRLSKSDNSIVGEKRRCC